MEALVRKCLDFIPNNAFATFSGVSGIDFTHLTLAGRPTQRLVDFFLRGMMISPYVHLQNLEMALPYDWIGTLG